MKKRLCLLIAAVLTIALAIPAAAADIPATQFIAAESVALDGGAVTVSSVDGAIGGKALECVEKADDSSGEGFTLKFTVDKDGTYAIWGRAYYPSVSNNSLHYSVDGGESLIWDFADEDEGAMCYNSWQYFYLTKRVEGTYEDTTQYGYWTIENNQWRHAPNLLELKKGEHSIHFTGRETGWYLDEFVVTELSLSAYDPNYYEGNSYILEECKFCGSEWSHYYKDIYAATGTTAEDYYYNTLYKAPEPETEAPAAETAAPEVTTEPSAPQTSDTAIAAAAIIIALAATVIVKKR